MRRRDLPEKRTADLGNFSRFLDLDSGILNPSPAEDARRFPGRIPFPTFSEIVIMSASLRRSVLSTSLVVMASLVAVPTAGAMGRSSTPSDHSSATQTAEQKNVATTLQSQVEALRQEVADLKARVERQDVAVAE